MLYLLLQPVLASSGPSRTATGVGPVAILGAAAGAVDEANGPETRVSLEFGDMGALERLLTLAGDGSASYNAAASASSRDTRVPARLALEGLVGDLVAILKQTAADGVAKRGEYLITATGNCGVALVLLCTLGPTDSAA